MVDWDSGVNWGSPVADDGLDEIVRRLTAPIPGADSPAAAGPDAFADSRRICDLVRSLNDAVEAFEREHPSVRLTINERQFPLSLTAWESSFSIAPTPKMARP